MLNTRRYDADNGLYYYKYRHYAANIGRWLGRDPIEEDGGTNLYTFVGNEPIGRFDMLGLAPLKKKKCCCGSQKKKFDPKTHYCVNNKVVKGKDAKIIIFISHCGAHAAKKANDAIAKGHAVRVANVSCYQVDQNGKISKGGYPNAKRNNEIIYWNWYRNGKNPDGTLIGNKPTFEQETKEEIAAAKVEAKKVCADMKNGPYNEVTVHLQGADGDGSKWLNIYYNRYIQRNVTKGV